MLEAMPRRELLARYKALREAGFTCHGSEAGAPSALLPPFFGEGSPTKMDYKKTGTLILTSLLEDLGGFAFKVSFVNRTYVGRHQLGDFCPPTTFEGSY